MLKKLKISDLENVWGGSKTLELPKGAIRFNETEVFSTVSGYYINTTLSEMPENSVAQYGINTNLCAFYSPLPGSADGVRIYFVDVNNIQNFSEILSKK